MTLKAKTFLLMALFLFLAALILAFFWLLEQQLSKVGEADSYNIRVRTITYGEVQR